MLNVVIRAPLLSISGYGVHCRQIFKWIELRKDMNVFSQVVQWGNTSWMINPDEKGGFVKRVISSSNGYPGEFDISFQVQLPDEWDPNLAKTNIGISAFVEATACNPSWIESMNKMDAVIVPSNHIRDMILKTESVKTKLFVIPEWYHEEIDSEEITKLDVDFETDFNFLSVAQFTGHDPETDRKNLFYTVKWFCEAFHEDKNVGLIIKTNHGRGTRIDRQITKNKLRALIGEVRKGQYPKIHLIHGNLTSEEVVSLYRHPKVKCLLSLTRGEGFGLPLLEAAASSLPVMATNWSAHLDFLNLGRFIPIDYSLVPIPNNKIDNRIFLPGMKWAEPIEKDFKKKVLRLRNKYSMPKQWASDLSHIVKSKFNANSIMLMYDEMLKQVSGV